MNFTTINDILHNQLAPWLPANKLMATYKVKLLETPEISFPTCHELEFDKPINDKYKYYYRIIKNEFYSYLTQFTESFNEADKEDHKRYLILKADGHLKQFFKNTQEVIERKNYDFEKINLPANKSIRDEIYIIHLIKNYLIWLYLEINELAKDQIDFDFLDESIIQADFFHSFNYKSFIKEVPEELKQEVKKEHFKQSKKAKFTPQPFDFREPNPDVMPYNEIISNADRFSSFEEKLYEMGYIDENYFFIKNKATNNSENFELVALAMIEKGLFLKTNLGKPIKDLEYRKFINHRYKSNVDKKFRQFRNDKAKIADFIETNIWLRNIPKY